MISRLMEAIRAKDAPVVVGLDPNLSFIPEKLLQESRAQAAAEGRTLTGQACAAEAILRFNQGVIDAVCDLVPAVKPQSAMYEQFGLPGLVTYEKTVRYAQQKGLIVIADVKRGDIGSTSAAYAAAHLGETVIEGRAERGFDADFATVNPYLGTDGIKPFIDVCNACDKGIFVLVKTSNPSSGEFQDVKTADGRALYTLVAEKVREWGRLSMDGRYSNVGAVVGATYPEQGKALRALMPEIFILAPGYGAQGASAADLLHFFDENGEGCIVNSSRGILAAWQKPAYAANGEADWAGAARAAAETMIEDLRGALRDRRQ